MRRAGALKWTRTRPSGSAFTASWAKGGRSMYRQRRAPLAPHWALIAWRAQGMSSVCSHCLGVELGKHCDYMQKLHLVHRHSVDE